MRLSYLHFALYSSVTVFITFHYECECTRLSISTFDSILKLMFICSCCDILMLVGCNYYGLIISVCVCVCFALFVIYFVGEGGTEEEGEREEFIYLNGFCFWPSYWA